MSLACQYYGNNPDGSLRQGGIKMSFQRTAPTVGGTPPRGTQDPPTGTNDFNLMAWQHLGGSSATTGRGLLDNGGDNAQLENNSGRNGSTGNELGCFPDRMVDFWNRSGISTSQRSLSNFCLGLAGTMAHECGHSIGLNHTAATPRAPATVNVMAASSVVDPAELYGFDQQTYTFMLSFMPGANRCMHPAGFTPRWLVQEASAVVVATPRALANGQLTLDVHAVLAGDLTAGVEATIAGFTEGAALERAELASVGRSIWFLSAGTEGYRFEGGEAEVLPLADRDEAEWTALIADQLRLQALAKTDCAAWTAEYAALLGHSLTSQDARIRGAALVELSLEAAVTKALSKDAALALAGIAGSADALEGQRLFALQALTHRADPALVGQLLAAGLSTDSARLQAAAAGALEQTLGLEGGATQVLAALEAAPASKARAIVLLGWLQAKGAVGLLTGELAAANAVAAADALGRIGDASALDALQAVAVDADRDQSTRDHALRAIGQIGGDAAKAFLTAQGTESARFARDFSATWLLE